MASVEADPSNNLEDDDDSEEEDSEQPSGFKRIEETNNEETKNVELEKLDTLIADIQHAFGITSSEVADPSNAGASNADPSNAGDSTAEASNAGALTAEMPDANSNNGSIPVPSPAATTTPPNSNETRSEANTVGNSSTANGGVSGLPAGDGTRSEVDRSDRNAVRREELRKDVIHIKKNLDYIKKYVKQVETSPYSERADEVLQHLMNAAVNQVAADFPEDSENLKHLLHIVAKLKQWIPPQRDNAAEESKKKKSNKKKKESPIVSKADKDNAAADIVKKLVSCDCKDWGMDGLLKSYGELKVRDKLCLLCFSVFLCAVDKVEKPKVLVQKNLVIKKKILIYWWVGEGLIHPNQPSPSPIPKSTTNTDPQNIPTEQNTNPITNPSSSTNADAQDIPTPDVATDQNPSPITNQIAATAEENQIPYQVWPPREDEGMTIEQIGDKILNVLRMKGFIEPVTKRGRESGSYQMLPFVHSFVTALAKKAGFFDFSKLDGKLTGRFGLSQRACLLKSQGSLPSSCSIWKGVIDNRTELKKFATVQTLFNVNESIIDIKPEWFSKMKYLSVLHLGSWRSEAGEHIEVEDPKFMEELKDMKQLKLFSLQGVATIMKLPESVCKLSSLIILDLRECHNLEELPANIGELKNLTHLDLTNCHLLTKLPIGISLLSKLEVLHWFVIYNQDGEKEAKKSCLRKAWTNTKGFVVHDLFRRDHKEVCTLKDLLKLGSLRELSIVVNRNEFPSKYEAELLMKMTELLTLKISWVYDVKDETKEIADTNQTSRFNNIAPGAVEIPGSGNKQEEQDTNQTSRSNNLAPGDVEIPGSGNTQEKEQDTNQTSPSNNLAPGAVEIPGSGNTQEEEQDTNQTSRSAVGIADSGNTQEEEQDTNQTSRSNNIALGAVEIADGGITQEEEQDANQTSRSNNVAPGAVETPHFKNLEKLELWCFPGKNPPPDWLVPDKMSKLKKLYIKGGKLETLGDVVLGDVPKIWNVETLRLKYLKELKIGWRPLLTMFPRMTYLEKFQCPKLGLFPCDHEGVWLKEENIANPAV